MLSFPLSSSLSAEVTGVSWCGDSRHFATSSVDNTVIIWKAFDPLPRTPTGTTPSAVPYGVYHNRSYTQGAGALRTLRGHTGWVSAVAWAPTGDIIASQEQEGAVIIWRSDGSPVARLSPETIFKHAAAKHAQQQDKEGKEGEQQPSSTPIITRPKPKGSMLTFSLTRLSFSCDGSFLVVCGLFNNAFLSILFSRHDWEPVSTYVGPTQSTTCASFSNHLFIDKAAFEKRKQSASSLDDAEGLFTMCAVGVSLPFFANIPCCILHMFIHYALPLDADQVIL